MIALYIIIALVVLTLGIAFYAYKLAFYVSPKVKPMKVLFTEQYEKHKTTSEKNQADLKALPFEPVTIRSYDGLKLFGRYYHTRDGAPLQIQCHGYRSSWFIDFSLGSRLAFERGFNVLLIDERAHGKSEGKTTTLGVKERKDVRAWIDYAIERFGPDQKIMLVGVSMGAATVVMASDLDLPKNVVGIVADCPYSSPKKAMKKLASDMGFPPNLIYPFAWLGALLFGGFIIESSSAGKSVMNTSVPILVLHGEDDRLIPCEMSDDIIKNSSSRAIKETFKNAGHGLSSLEEPERYKKILYDFCESVGV